MTAVGIGAITLQHWLSKDNPEQLRSSADKRKIVLIALLICLCGVGILLLYLFLKPDTNLKTVTRQEQSLSACATLESGFGDVESWGVWTVAKTAELSLVLPARPARLLISFKAQPFGKLKYVEVFYGSQKLAHWSIQKPAPENYILDCSALPRRKRIKLTFRNDEVSRPFDLINGSQDKRTLGIGFCSVRVIDK